MRVEFKPISLVAAIGGFALGHYTPVAVAKTGRGSGNGGETKKQMSCEEAVKVANVALAVSAVLLAFGDTVGSALCTGFASGVMTASCPSSE